ncbi:MULTISPECIES: hypothetical protein [Niastella]|uniref:Uncharacterized protein n=1 Tax=Niastella soli TaxID=2821487 RepID=A0ABS3Z5M7_9BACT|nr:hypothetical protein [Niastella soli]MBO9205470.1 hypothetical protein [Niastella soli]
MYWILPGYAHFIPPCSRQTATVMPLRSGITVAFQWQFSGIITREMGVF